MTQLGTAPALPHTLNIPPQLLPPPRQIPNIEPDQALALSPARPDLNIPQRRHGAARDEEAASGGQGGWGPGCVVAAWHV